MSQKSILFGCLDKSGQDKYLKLSHQSQILFLSLFWHKEHSKSSKQISGICSKNSKSNQALVFFFHDEGSFFITLSRRRFLSYRNQFIDLLCIGSEIPYFGENNLSFRNFDQFQHYVFGPVFGYLTRSTVILKSNSCKGCFNQVTFYNFQNFCQSKVKVKIFWTVQSLTLN